VKKTKSPSSSTAAVTPLRTTKMAMSGVKLTNECQNVYQAIQKDKKFRYAIFKIDDSGIVLDKTGERNNTYDQFLDDLQVKDGDNDDCRYAVYDYDYVQQAEGTEASYRSKLFLMSWCPDSAKIKKKMIYSSSFDTLKKAFVGVHKVIQSNGADELEQAHVESILKATDRK
jgi:cofilin